MIAVASKDETVAVVLEQVVARDTEGHRGRPRGRLLGASLRLGPGVHAVVGRPEDGMFALFDVLVGARRPIRGSVRVGGADPHAEPGARRRIASVGYAPDLPGTSTVSAAVDLCLRARGDAGRAATEVLQACGIAALAKRPVHGLSFAEARSVEFALAFALEDPVLFVLFEPHLETVLSPAVLTDAALGARRCILLLTSNIDDAYTDANEIHLLTNGFVATGLPTREASEARNSVEIVVWLDPQIHDERARALVIDLLRHPAVTGVHFEGQGRGGPLRIFTSDEESTAATLVAAAIECEVALRSISVSRLQTRARPSS